MAENIIFDDANAIAAKIPDGAKIAIFKDAGIPFAVASALVRRDAKNLHLVTVPTGGIVPDMLIGAGCIAILETAGISLGEFGAAREFTNAVKAGRIEIWDTTCPAIYSGLQAAEKGIPFMPMRGLIGSDTLKSRADYQVIENPFGGDRIVAVPAIVPDFALIHVPLADEHGNLWIGRQGELKIMAHAARRTFATAEEITSNNIMENEELASAAISSLYVSGIALAPKGAWPMDMPGHYGVDRDAMKAYARVSGTDQFAAWVNAHVLNRTVAAE